MSVRVIIHDEELEPYCLTGTIVTVNEQATEFGVQLDRGDTITVNRDQIDPWEYETEIKDTGVEW